MQKSTIVAAMGMTMAIIKTVETPLFPAQRNKNAYHFNTAFNFHIQAYSSRDESMAKDTRAKICFLFLFSFLGSETSFQKAKEKKLFLDNKLFFFYYP